MPRYISQEQRAREKQINCIVRLGSRIYVESPYTDINGEVMEDRKLGCDPPVTGTKPYRLAPEQPTEFQILTIKERLRWYAGAMGGFPDTDEWWRTKGKMLAGGMDLRIMGRIWPKVKHCFVERDGKMFHRRDLAMQEGQAKAVAHGQ